MDSIPFPRYLDAPTRLLFWTVDQIVPFMILALVGMMTHTLLLCLFLGSGISWGFTRYRDSRPDGFLQHMAYWYGLVPLNGRACLNPFTRQVYPP